MDILFKHTRVLFIAVTLIKGLVVKHRSGKYIMENPCTLTYYTKLGPVNTKRKSWFFKYFFVFQACLARLAIQTGRQAGLFLRSLASQISKNERRKAEGSTEKHTFGLSVNRP